MALLSAVLNLWRPRAMAPACNCYEDSINELAENESLGRPGIASPRVSFSRIRQITDTKKEGRRPSQGNIGFVAIYAPGAFGAPGAPGTPGAFGAPAPGAPGMPGILGCSSGSFSPHFAQTSASGSFTFPHFGHFFGRAIALGLKHIIYPFLKTPDNCALCLFIGAR